MDRKTPQGVLGHTGVTERVTELYKELKTTPDCAACLETLRVRVGGDPASVQRTHSSQTKHFKLFCIETPAASANKWGPRGQAARDDLLPLVVR